MEASRLPCIFDQMMSCTACKVNQCHQVELPWKCLRFLSCFLLRDDHCNWFWCARLRIKMRPRSPSQMHREAQRETERHRDREAQQLTTAAQPKELQQNSEPSHQEHPWWVKEAEELGPPATPVKPADSSSSASATPLGSEQAGTPVAAACQSPAKKPTLYPSFTSGSLDQTAGVSRAQALRQLEQASS